MFLKARDPREVAHKTVIKLGEQFPGYFLDMPVEDNLTNGYYKFIGAREVSAWYVFANQVLLDVQYILGDQVTAGWESYRAWASYSASSLEAFHETFLPDT